MSVKHGLLALLADGPRYGYQLRADFETRTGGAWPLNAGQVYTTLGRLERDGLVVQQGQDSEGHLFYALAEPGRQELASWLETPVDRAPPPRDELAIKLALAADLSGVDPRTVVQRQRTATVSSLQGLTRQRAQALDASDLGCLIVLDALRASAEAELRFLDTCDARFADRKATP